MSCLTFLKEKIFIYLPKGRSGFERVLLEFLNGLPSYARGRKFKLENITRMRISLEVAKTEGPPEKDVRETEMVFDEK